MADGVRDTSAALSRLISFSFIRLNLDQHPRQTSPSVCGHVELRGARQGIGILVSEDPAFPALSHEQRLDMIALMLVLCRYPRGHHSLISPTSEGRLPTSTQYALNL
ncbi:hypothetical protein E2C01_024126 [Portunus trituberculatus]|uniref:Uncharacterized protein n=1 Tax=Portunus trituberculatus TaxID=210409 RepID=A0A5B7EBW2_PORTR|nr:hypothetical protein [Portunus trituberculatus]